MSKIILDILPAKGHFHATLKLASLLKKAGYQIIYGSTQTLKADVLKYDFLFEDIPQTTLFNFTFSTWRFHTGKSFSLFLRSLDRKSETDARIQIEELENKIRAIAPELVLLDEQCAPKALVYEKLGIPVLLFQTKPDTRKIRGIPPFTSFFLPSGSLGSTFFCSLLWMKRYSKLFCIKYLQILFCFGQDNYSLLFKVLQYPNSKKRIELMRSFELV